MKSITHGKDNSGVEVTNITKHGIWLLTGDNELFISFKAFPKLLDASVSKLMNVEQPNPRYLHWADLDMDLAVESVRSFPLTSTKSRPSIRSRRAVKTKAISQLHSDLRSAPIGISSREQKADIGEDAAPS
jgi:hypothetical protein